MDRQRRRRYTEKYKVKQRRYYEKTRNARKSKRLKLRFAILRRYGFTCQYCGRKSPDVELQIDHIFPKSKGGLDNIENYTVACMACNYGKNDCILNEFIKI